MRRRVSFAIAALVLASAATARAQQSLLPSQPLASIDFGVRFADVAGDEARYQRFRDLGNGAFFDRLRFDRDRDGWHLELAANHVGRLDQRYFAEYRRNGTVKISFEWDQVPLFISGDTRTLYTTASPGVLRIADSIQQGIEGQTLRLADVVGQARRFDTKSRRDTATFNFVYSPTRAVDVKFNLKSSRREGTMPWVAAFGFSNATEVAAPIDTRTTDVTTGIEWADQRGSVRVGYYGSWFDNNVQTLIWDNPVKYTDSTNPRAYVLGDGTSQGRMALSPSSTLHSVSAGGAIKLPARSRATASLSVGGWRQDEPLLPFTINTAIPAVPLERQTAEAEARTVGMNYSFTSRPSRHVWLNARYRFYDFDNRTPHFSREHWVRLDQVAEEGHGESEPYGYTRHNFDVDASFTPVGFTAFKVGYGRGVSDRAFRIFERTKENVVRATVDTTGNPWVMVRAIYEFSTRTGSGFDQEFLDEVGEQPAMRHFDIADRNRNRFTGLVQVTPIPALGFSVSAALGNDDYENSGFGLRDNKNRAYSFTLDVTPSDILAAGVSYSYEKYTALQNSRNASPGAQFVDPTRNWSIDSADKVHTVGGNVDLLKVIPKTEVRLAYDFTRSKAAYHYGVVPGSTLFPGGVFPQERQLPPVVNELHTGTADLRYFLTERLAIGLMYWYDAYRVDDFALGPQTINRLDLPGSLFLGYVYRPYTANSAWLRLLYFW